MCEIQGLKPGDDVFRILTPFGKGSGRSGCQCGALAGSAMFFGMLYGRLEPNESNERAYSITKKLHEGFKKKFSATCCRTIRGGEFGSLEQKRKCSQIVEETTNMADEILMDMERETK